jgi:predicted MFS family arabinose efflux permease
VVGAAAALLTLGSAFGPIMGAMTVDAGGLPLLAGLTALLSVVAFGLMVPAARVRQSAGVKR